MLFKLEKKFSTDDRLKKMYHDFLKEFEDSGNMSLLSLSELNSFSDCFYVPHHGVWKEKSSSSKLLTVLNGYLKLESGISLNALLYSGPNLLPKLADSLLT